MFYSWCSLWLMCWITYKFTSSGNDLVKKTPLLSFVSFSYFLYPCSIEKQWKTISWEVTQTITLRVVTVVNSNLEYGTCPRKLPEQQSSLNSMLFSSLYDWIQKYMMYTPESDHEEKLCVVALWLHVTKSRTSQAKSFLFVEIFELSV